MKEFLKREKFETELGRIMFDELKAIDYDPEWMYVVFYHCRGDENKKKFLDWLQEKERTKTEIIFKACLSRLLPLYKSLSIPVIELR